ncbi:hypothetical protein Mgra_00008953 [Meloidogyne graminicola]|uniref:Uncharacterized protein n=1 Tax=Meloidogyne graminicola TaxID=189291 RepID=A0A8S9ZEC4_9BILA|nr:hypothetical protein Mgra_00008953 [Meloidogyne graminicola]
MTETKKLLTDVVNLNDRIQRLLSLMDDKSLGDSQSSLLLEIRSTLSSFKQNYHLLNNKSKGTNNSSFVLSKDIDSKRILHSVNTLKTTFDKLAIFLETQFLTNLKRSNYNIDDCFSKLCKECSEIREELFKLNNRFESNYFDSLLGNATCKDTKSNDVADPSTQIFPITHGRQNTVATFWRSYLFMCLVGIFTSFVTLIYINSCDGVDWRWSFGPQLHYQKGPPPI